MFIAPAAISGYFIGRGMTRIILWVNLAGVLVNVVLDYLLIFGHGGFPRLGVTGAALASVARRGWDYPRLHRLPARDWDGRRCMAPGDLNPPLRRLLRYGTSNGVQLTLDMVAWTSFLLLVGRLGVTAQGATRWPFN